MERKLDKIYKKKTNVISRIMQLSNPSQIQYNLVLPKNSPNKLQTSTPKRKGKIEKII